MRFEWAAATDRGRVREQNEDSTAPLGSGSDPGPFLAGVADGMGGAVAGEVASRTALDTAFAVGGDPVVRVQAANVAVIDAIREQPRLQGMGTTLTLADFRPDGTADIAHVGDSRAYLLRDGTLSQVTDDHSYVAEMVASGRLDPEDVDAHPYRNVVTRVIGIDPDLEVDHIELELQNRDRVLLCSDGLTTMLEDDRIAGILGAEGRPEDVARALVSAANEAGGLDNVSVVVVDVASGDGEG